ncbi:hypothetical protein L228DRAFT_156374 [Xylona heveae TC161]|uniref:Aminoglycoside phosphotransferase domain-containing protein n=1 Tax=Xylona heveae (strain CBS 132557 / TC161) TaxID=1328760 RepID=A0A165G0Q4_XYLHT|nr:hypothetical protein L228DRAFT_156374 [Xylona heveae TC161]KZF21602.1 hypothetical protein L228DRAFT_156374 [Xylona heveae TC161]
MDFNDFAEIKHQQLGTEWSRKFHIQRDTALAKWISSFREHQESQVIGDCFGSFNWSCIVQFNDGVKWIVRFAVPGQVMDPDEKVPREVATMRIIQERTSIPVPAIHAWGLSKDNPLELGAFIIMDYVEGKDLGKLWEYKPTERKSDGILKSTISEQELRVVYRQIAGFLLELSRLEFDKGGALFIHGDQTIDVEQSPLTLKMQEIEAHGGVRVGGCRDKLFSSATDYFSHVAEQDLQHLLEQPNSIDDAEDARSKYKFRSQLLALIPRFVNKKYDRSPFRLICDDMRLGNILVNNETELKIVAVLDWEWAYTAPYQMFFSPPRWLLIKKPTYWTSEDLDRYKTCLELFLHVLAQEETDRYKDENHLIENPERLSDLMRQSMDDGKLWFHELMYACYEGANNPAWQAICKLHPDLDDFAPIPESTLDGFSKTKMEQLQKYEAEWAKKQAELDREQKELEALIEKVAAFDPELAEKARKRLLTQ